MVVISGRSLLIQLLLVLLILASFSEVSHGKGSDPVLSTSGTYIHFPGVDIPLPDFVPDVPPTNFGIPGLPSIGVSPSPPPPRQSPPPPSPPPPRQSPPPPSPPPPQQSPPPPPQQSPPPPPPSTDSFVIPPFLVGPIDPTPKIIPPLIPGFPSIINPTPSSQLSPPLIKSPSQCKPSPPDQSAKQPPPPPPKQPPPPRAPSPSPSPAKQPPPPPPRAPSPSPARQPTPPPVKAPPPPSNKSPPPAPPPSIANQPVMAPSPSPAVIIAPFPSSPVAKPPLVPRRPVKPILPPAKTLTVNGLVRCKPCKSYGVPTLLNASPLQGASVRLVCYNGKNAIVQSAITDNNGEFRVTPKSLMGADIGKCKVDLVKSPNPTCNVPTNFNGGKTGALLQHIVPPKPPIVTPAVVVPVQPPATDLYGVGPFIFEASSKMPCANMHKKL